MTHRIQIKLQLTGKSRLILNFVLPGGILTSLAPAGFLKAHGQIYFSLVNNLVSLVMPVNL